MSALLKEHLEYLSLPHRLDLYRQAIKKIVRPDDAVVDAGCGTGVLGLLCLEAGAGKIFAIDSSAAIELARESLGSTAWSPKIEFVRGRSFQVTLPERVDVVICDHVGYFGFDYGLIGLLSDARRRFLKPNGRLIPGRLKLHVGAVESLRCHHLTQGWNAPGIPKEFHRIRKYGVNAKHAVVLQRDELVSSTANLGCIDLQIDNPEFFSFSAQLTIQRDGVMHGIGGWFDCELAEDVWMTNSPLADDAIGRSQAFFPIDGALPVKAGDQVDVTVMARPADDVISWVVTHPVSGRRFGHSTWQGSLLGIDQLARTAPDHVPRPSQATVARQLVLSYCDGRRSVAQVQDAVLREHPALFPSAEEIKRFVISVLGSDTQ